MSDNALQRVLAALERVGSRWRHQSGGYVAQCPAHDDRNPSLSVKNGDGKVLLSCKAHCQTSDVLYALGLQWADLFDQASDAPEQTRPTIIATYDYRDTDGALLYQKVRYIPKDFRVRRRGNDGNWIWNIGDDTPRVLYHLPEVLAAARAGNTVYVCEGEKDVDRLIALGHVATCNYDGASKDTQRPKWRDTYSRALTGAHVVIIADKDQAGYAHARAAAASLTNHAASVTVVRGAVTDTHADLSDHLNAGYTLDELVPIELNDAPPTDPELPEPPPDDEDFLDDPLERIFQHEVAAELRKLRVRDEARRLHRAQSAEPLSLPTPILLSDLLAEPDQPVRYRIDGLLPAGGRVVLAAQFKAGKSTLIGNLVRCLVDAQPFLGAHHIAPTEGRIVVVDNEMPRDTLKYWLRDQNIHEANNVAVIPTRGNVASFDIINPDVRRKWVELISSYQPSVLILDCLRPVLDALGLDENTDAGQVLIAMDEIAEKSGATELVIVHHMGHLNERSRGSSRMRDWPDVEWRLVRKDPDDPSSQRFFTAYGRDVDVSETALEFDPVTRHLSLAGGNRTDAAALALLPDLFDLVVDQPGLSGRAIENLLMDVGTTRAISRNAINHAVDQGYLITTPGPSRSTLYYPSRTKVPDRQSSAPVRRSAPTINGALAHSPAHPQQKSGAPKDQQGEAAGHSSSAPVRRSAPTINGALESGQCDGAGGGGVVRPPPPGALNPQVTAPVRRSSPANPSQPQNDQAAGPTGDQWLHAHLTTTPQTIARLATQLDATTTTIETALTRLEYNGLAQCHTQTGKSDTWSLPTKTKENK